MTDTYKNNRNIYLSIVIPVYNSSSSLEELYERLSAVLALPGETWEIIMVDDNSSDNSFNIIKSLRERDRRVKFIKFSKNHGQHSALLCGLKHAEGKYVITMDDDLQHPPEEIPGLLKKIDEGYEVVIGNYESKKHSFFRNIGTFAVNLLISSLSGKALNLQVTNFKCFLREAIMPVIEYKGRFFYFSMLLFSSIPPESAVNCQVKHMPRKYGSSGYDFLKLLKLFLFILIYHSPLPLIFIISGLAASLAGIRIFMLNNNLLLLFFGIIFTSAGIAGQYIKYLSLNYGEGEQFFIEAKETD